ncbi:MAG: hypothetical protein CVV44_05390 [Spirochaetae bacterium HGW-Spirochaetae-1]|jgi:hypothetical protein|nr:MAG: hypothetical protein CVV44_05390 [Spirochaetae bacterium HGW-Spirochaetae-1]
MIRDHSIKRETIIGAFILAALALVAVAILLKQAHYNLSEYGLEYKEISTGGKTVGTGKKHGDTFDTATLVPAGFRVYTDAEIYDAVTLYEKIDGKAPLYLSSGFRELVTRRYMHTVQKGLWIEIFLYDMGSFNNAFSVYSQQKRADGVSRPDVQYCYTTENSEVMAAGAYYIEINGSQGGAIIKDAAAEISRKIRDTLGAARSINVLDYLKCAELVPQSEIYYLNDAFGMEGFSRVYSAKFLVDGVTTTVFISGPNDYNKRQAVIKNYTGFLVNEGAVAEKNGSSVKDMTLLNFDESYETIFHAGDFVAGVHEADTKDRAIKVSEILYNAIRKNSGGE